MLQIMLVDFLRELARHAEGLPADVSVKWAGCRWNALQISDTVKFAVGCGYAEAADGRLRITKNGVARMNRTAAHEAPLPTVADSSAASQHSFSGD